MDPLSSARQKIERAGQHLEQLRAEGEAFLLGGHLSLRSENNLDERGPQIWLRYFVDKYTDPPAYWPLLAGDVVQNFSAALDHAAWALIVRAKGEGWAWDNRTRIYFPVRTTKEAFDNVPLLKHLGPDLVAVFEELQPFKVPPAASPENPIHFRLRHLGPLRIEH